MKMAVATKKVKTVKVMKEVLDIQTESVTLTLSPEEAKVLMLVCANIGGCPRTSFRKYTDDILFTLRNANVPEITCENDNMFIQPISLFFKSNYERFMK